MIYSNFYVILILKKIENEPLSIMLKYHCQTISQIIRTKVL
jgi:hypothetical protein